MSQITNLNVSPYFDDFDADNDYYKVLFKPGYPVQARELTTLQSILQNQVEKFGQHFFKEGAKVIPGNTSYNQFYYAVELNNTYLGVPVDAYVDQLIGTKITGSTSGITAVVENVLLSTESERENVTLYVNYLSSSTQNNSTVQFLDGESIFSNTTITSGLLGNTTIPAGTPFAITVASNATSTGSSFSISEGVYFIRGYFVKVNTETLILDQYSNNPNYRVGLFVNEEIVNSDIDEALNDNSQGFNNYAAPGADRLKISTSLFKKDLTDFNDNNFIELATIVDGVIKTNRNTKEYNLIQDELARRTYAESGDYYVTPFDLSIKESLNDGLGNRGIFNQGQFTYGGSTPSENLSLYQISPGKAFVRGYEVETISPVFLDSEKPRTTATLKDLSINYNTGSTFAVNRVFGSPVIGIGNTYTLSLRDSRVGLTSYTAAGKEIGLARVYDFRLESGSYDTTNSNLNQWNISLYDIQTTTEITLNEPITLAAGTFIKGKNSGATAFLKDAVTNSGSIAVYQKNGDFILNESFIFDGITNSRVATAITSYGISDIKSVYGIVGTAKTFNADTIQSDIFNVGVATISAHTGGISIVSSTNINFPGNIVKVGNLVKYSNSLSSLPVYGSVLSVGATTISISGVTTVPGIIEGGLPTSTISVSDFKILGTSLTKSSDDTLYTILPKPNIASVDLTEASLTIRKTFDVTISNNQLSTQVVAGENETFLPFDEERYSLIRSDGTTEVLTSDRFAFDLNSTALQIYNLGANGTATLVATLRKIKPKSKVKLKNRVSALVIDKSKYQASGIGSTTLDDGLSYGNYPYGTRVQDENISLNVPDIINVYGVYESKTSSDSPSAPVFELSSINGPTTKTGDLIVGEQFIGQLSGAIGVYAERLDDSRISFISLNENTFKEGESIVFSESNISANIVSVTASSSNISANFKFDNGQKGSFYGYGSINRLPGSQEPSRKIKVYFASGYYQSSDDGDITTKESYNGFDYKKDIQIVNSVRNSDIIDIRPRVSSYTVAQNSRSPLEFYGRTFNGSGNSAANILASDESITTTFSYYLGRIDRIYVRKDGTFQVKYGVPSEKPEKPISVEDALEIATVTLPPYLFDISQASVQFLEHKRYRMVDIKQLENRIKNLEYYTALSMLETNTANLFVPDSEGLDRFKSGFFVDNFSSLNTQENGLSFENSIDPKNKELRPKHYTTAIDLIQGPVEGIDSQVDYRFETPEGNNIRKTGDLITLDYSEVEWLKQSFATRTENVTPFVISFWQGTIDLTPSTDTWVDTVRLDAKVINKEGNYSQVMALAQRQFNVDPQSGYAPTVWGSWETNWTGKEVVETVDVRTDTTNNYGYYNKYWWGWPYGYYGYWGYWGWNRGYATTTVTQDTYREVKETGIKSRTGTTSFVAEQFDRSSVGDKVVSRDLVQYLRSRNIQFVAKNVKPSTQLYAFFDGVDVTKYCVPKLLEISMISGVFEVGETVIGNIQKTGLNDRCVDINEPKITFRVSQSNHKEGPYNTPTTTYALNPYTNQTLPASYSSTSNILNVDTFSLCTQYQGEFSGWVESGMTLVGKTSGAKATITNVRLVSDGYTSIIGSFYIPNPNISVNPRFENGSKTFTLINNTFNDRNLASTIAEEKFVSSGTIETIQENIISTRNARIEQKQELEKENVSKTTGAQLVGSNVVSKTTNWYRCPWWDPLAQSFLVKEESGIFLTRCDIFFKSKDDTDIPVLLQIRTMQGGYPTQTILPFSEIILDPDQVNISSDGTVATSFTFDSPVYLEGGKEYAVVVGSNSNKYNVFISRVGEVDFITQSYISNQPYLGSLFKSQNASTWEPSQWEDLKFTLYRADFLNSGSVEFYSPELSTGNSQIPTLLPDSLILNSRKIRIGLSSAISDTGLTLGNTILQQGTNATGNYVGNAGIATGTLQVINAGIGYTPSSGSLTFNSVDLVTITGNGRNAKANVTVQNGVAIAATVITSGNGYKVGDVLGISTLGSSPVGRNALFSLVSIASTNELLLDNVQGEFSIAGTGKTVQYINNSGSLTTLNASSGGNVQISDINVDSDGLHIIVNHKNHGMYFNDNYVKISGVESDVPSTILTSQYSYQDTGSILINNSANFTTFENVGVGTTNPGYALIANELFEYTAVSAGSLDGVTSLGVIDPVFFGNLSTLRLPVIPANTPVYKYELGGVSLKRINTTHYLGNASVTDPISFDSYAIKVQMDQNGTDRYTGSDFPKLYLNQTKSAGGFNIKATQNIPFELITPLVQNITVQGTTINAELRTTTGSSISGEEIAYVDSGFESVVLNRTNYFKDTKIIASKVNEDARLGSIMGKKSMNLRMFLNSVDSRVSPVIDTQRVSAVLTSNRVNNVITDYATDNRVNTIGTDPSAFQYISKEITLENPATSIKILLDGHLNNYCDIRAFYAIGESQNFIPIFTPFPGYKNLDARKQVISFENSDGLPDAFVQPSLSYEFGSGNVEFREYSFTADQLPSFRFYRIKLVLTSTNQVYSPRVKNLRVIALA